MAIVHIPVPLIRLIRHDGATWHFHSLTDLAHALDQEGKRYVWERLIGADFVVRAPCHIEWSGPTWQYVRTIQYNHFQYIIRNGSEVVLFSQVPRVSSKRPKQPDYAHQYRCDAVQGTGRWKRSHQRRNPSTLQERRWNDSDEHNPFVRRARCKTYMPTGWDMPFRKSQRSWKKHRRTQWK